MKEILIIKTAEAEKMKSVLDREHINYQIIYDENLDRGLTKEEIWRRDARLASQDKERNEEIAEWDRLQAIDDAKLNKNDEDYWRQAVRAASRDEQRNKEIAAWDKIASKVEDK
jgi:hypothetical protein